MPDMNETLAGGGITAALLALLYGIKKMIQRSRCRSHNECCELDIERENERKETERATIVEMVLQKLGIEEQPREEEKEMTSV